MNISRLHYISQELNGKSHIELIENACIAGIDWVQLRVKDKSFEETLMIAEKAKEICLEYNAKLIINDHVVIAKKVNADGVHLGKEDINPAKAREILGPEFIIGATANTMEDIKEHHLAKVDYIGLGPFRFTTTKENLSPVIGLEGYEKIIKECKNNNTTIPVIAIGGIVPEDIAGILKAGLYGVAVSSVINKAENKKKIVELFNSQLRQMETIKLSDHVKNSR
jgi:thiamine-phosphate pyrophosphorylase